MTKVFLIFASWLLTSELTLWHLSFSSLFFFGSSINVFFLYNVSKKSTDAAANNESWKSFCHLYHQSDRAVPADSVISGLHSWTLKSIKLLLVILVAWDILVCNESSDGKWIIASGWQKSRHPGSLGKNLILLYFELVPCTSSVIFCNQSDLVYLLLSSLLNKRFLDFSYNACITALWVNFTLLITLRSQHSPPYIFIMF